MRWLLGVALPIGLLTTCITDPVAPGTAVHARMSLRGLFLAGGPTLPIAVDTVIVEFRRLPDSTLAFVDTVSSGGLAGTGGDSVVVSVTLKLDESPQDFYFRATAKAGGVAYYQASGTVHVVAGESATPPPIAPTYVGPGATADSLTFVLDTLIQTGDSVLLSATVRKSGALVSGVPIGFRSSDTTLVKIHRPAALGLQQGWAVVVATTVDSVTLSALAPNGLTKTGRLRFLPRAASLIKVSGDNQTVPPGTQAAQPLVVRVLDLAGKPYPAGYLVRFALTTAPAGTTIAPTQVVTDAQGLAQTVLTSGSGGGAVTVTVTAGNLAGSPLSFAATVPAPTTAWDAAADFSGTANPNGQWRSGWTATLGSSLTLYSSVATQVGLTLWQDPAIVQTNTPSFGKNTTAGAISGVGPGQVELHDGCQASQYSVLRWTAPSAAGYLVNAQWLAGDIGNTDANLLRNGNGAAPLFTATSTTSNPSYSEYRALAAGDTYDWVVGAGGDGCTGDLTPVIAVVLAQTTAPTVTSTVPNQNALVGTAVATPPAVQVLGSNSLPIPGVTVVFAVTGGGGSLTGAAAITNASGIATVGSWTLGATPGTNTMTATVPGITPANFQATGVGPATALAFVVQPASTTAGVSITPAIQVAIRDAQGNTVTSATGAITLAISTNPGGGTLSGGLTVSAVNGVATFPGLSIDKPGVGYTLAASATGLTGATSTAFDVTLPSPSLIFATQPASSQTAGAAFTVVVQARDGLGNVVTGFTGGVTVAFGANPAGGTLGGTLTTSAVAGVATFTTLNVTKAGTGYTLVASASGYTNATSAAFTVAAAAPAALAFTVQPSSVSAAAAITPAVVVAAQDAFGNVATGFTGSVTVAIGANPTGGTLSGTLTATAASGLATFANLSIDKGGSGYTLTASAAGLTGATSSAFTVLGAPATQLAFTVQPVTSAAGAIITPAVVVTARDAQGNTATTFTGNVTVALGANPGGAVLSGTTTVAAVAGVATFGDLSLTARSAGYTLTASSGSLAGATSVAFDITANTLAWTNPAGGSWKTASNWSLGRVPVSTDSVIIALAGTYTVTLDTTFTGAFITVGGGGSAPTLSISSRTLTISGAMTIASGGAFTGSSSTIAGPGSVTNNGALTLSSSSISGPLVNNGTLVFRGAGSFTGGVTTGSGSLLRLQGSSNGGGASLTVSGGLTNNAGIELTDSVSSYGATLTVTGGALVNAPTGTITTLAGTAGGRTLTASLTNQGTLTVSGAQGLTLSGASTTHTNSGTINVSGGNLTLNQSGTTPSFTNTGTITINTGLTWTVSSGTLNLNAGGTIGGAGTLSLSNVTWNLGTDFTNALTGLVLASTTVNGPGVLTNASAQPLVMVSSTLAAGLVNNGTLVFRGVGSFTGGVTTGSGSLLRLQGSSNGGGAGLTVTGGLTNSAAIELTDSVSSYGATLTVTGGALVNTGTGTITALAGTAGGRTLTASLTNQGTLTVSGSQGMTLSGASTTHTNSGTISVSGGNLTLNQSGTTPSFTNTGTITINPGLTWTVSGGTLNYNGGTIGGAGTLSLSNVTWNLGTDFTNALTGLVLASTTVNGPGGLTNASGQLLVMVSSTVNAALTNNGTLVFRGVGSFTGGVTTGSGSLLRLQGSSNGGGAGLTVSGGFTNSAAIELTDSVSSYGATLTVTGAALVNTATGTITALAGANGGRTLAAVLTNQGTLTVGGPQGLILGVASAVHTNSGTFDVSGGNLTVNQSGTTPSFTNTGTVTIGSGRTWTVSGGTLNYNGGTIGGAGTLSLSSVTWNLGTDFTNALTGLVLASVTVNGPGVLTNASGQLLAMVSTTVNAGLVNNGTLAVRGVGSFTGGVTTGNGSLLRLQGSSNGGGASLTVTGGLTNSAGIELTDSVSSYGATLTVTGGALVNTGTGTITALTGANGGRTLTASLTNQGTLTVSGAQGLTLSGASTTHSNSGTISVSGGNLTLNQSGTTPSFTNTGTVTIGSGRTWTVSGGTLNYNGGTIGGTGTLSLSSVTWNLGTDFTNALTGLVLASTTVNGPGVLTNASAQFLVMTSSTVNAGLANNGTLVFRGVGSFTGGVTTGSGSLLRLQGSSNGGGASLTVSGGLTNSAGIELTDSVSSYGATLTVTGGALVNTATGTIAALTGTNGGRTLAAVLTNQGTLTVSGPQGLTLGVASAAHTNSGTFDISGGNLTLNQSGTTPSFTNTGAVLIGLGRTWTVSGGTLNYNTGGTIGGGGTLSLSGVTMNLGVDFTNAVTGLVLSSTTVNGPGVLTNASAQLLVMTSSTVNAGLVNNGTLVFRGVGSFTGAVTTGSGSLLRVQGSSNGGGANLTVAPVGGGLTNSAAIELTDSVSSYGATLTVTGAALVNTATGTITALTGANGGRTLAATLTNQGTLTVHPLGSSNGLNLTGTLATTGTINLELGGTAQGTQYSRLSVSGTVVFGGTLNVTLINAFTPTTGSTFTVMGYALSTPGVFTTYNFPAAIGTPPSITTTALTLTAQ